MPLVENALRPPPRERLLELLASPRHSVEGEELLLCGKPMDAGITWEIW